MTQSSKLRNYQGPAWRPTHEVCAIKQRTFGRSMMIHTLSKRTGEVAVPTGNSVGSALFGKEIVPDAYCVTEGDAHDS